MKPTSLPLALLIGFAVPVAGWAQPAILTHPEPQSVVLGADATFSVMATGTAPLTYQWQKDSADLAGSIETTLALTNVQPGDAGDYRAVITDTQGAIASDVARLTVLFPPLILPVGQPRDTAVAEGSDMTFTVSARGTSPFSYQWRLDGVDLSGATNRSLTMSAVQSRNAGAYAVLVGNLAGSATSQAAQLSVAQGHVFTNAQGARLSYRLFFPPRYDPAKKYPLVLFAHGSGDSGTDNLAQLTDQGQFVFLSATNQSRYPCFYLAPQIPAPGSGSGGFPYYGPFHDLTVELLTLLQAQYSIDADRLYVTGLSLGGFISWALVARYPDFFAAAVPMSGGVVPDLADLIPGIRVPVWNFHANDDGAVPVSRSDAAVAALRNAGGNPIYTRYQTGGHGIWQQAYRTPGLVDWTMAQVRGAKSTSEPLLSITNPTQSAVYMTGAPTLELTGTAIALEQPISTVSWLNLANNASGQASGTNTWSATDIPVQAGKTNIVLVTATTTSWAPALGGNTTFTDILAVVAPTIRVTMTLQGSSPTLNWTGGAPPYRVQSATDLAVGDWTDSWTNATPPITLFPEQAGGFYRIIAQ